MISDSESYFCERTFSLKLTFLALLSASLLLLGGCGGGGGGSSVIVDPNVQRTNHPLVAQYSLTTTDAASVAIQFGPTTSYGFSTSSQAVEANTPTDILVAGMKPNTLYHMRAVVTENDGTQHYDDDRTFTTAAVDSARVPAIQVTTTPGMAPASGVELLNLQPGPSNQFMIVAVDPQGNLIWYYDFDTSLGAPQPTKLLSNGHVMALISENPGVPGGTLQEIDLAGDLLHQFDYTQLQQKLNNAGYSIHVLSIDHDFVQLPNGHLLIIVSDTRVFTDLPGYPGQTTVTGNAVVDLDSSYNPVWVWDAFDHLDINRHPMNFPDWTHANALVYIPDDGNILLSLRHQSWVLKIDYENGNGTGDVLWKLGYQGDFDLTSGDDSQWFAAQHDVNLASKNGTGNFQLAMFDNGDDRVIDGSLIQCEAVLPPLPNCYSVAAIFDVNESTMSATRQWGYQTPYSFWGGVTQVLPNSNIFIDEATPADLNNQGMRALEVTQIANPQVVWQLQIDNQNSYRTIHLPSLYPGVQW
ncbi:MAG TPA: aryl-sulfate sulfotransferase [Terriglobales bacterium]|nr:aryl-sulfate sulfotransferase [Terriglobales bacterium]